MLTELFDVKQLACYVIETLRDYGIKVSSTLQRNDKDVWIHQKSPEFKLYVSAKNIEGANS